MSSENRLNQKDTKVLIDMAMKGNLDAFNELVLMYQNVVYNHAYAVLGDSDRAEEATQEGFLKAFQNLGNFRGGSFHAWLLRIVTNSAYDLLRRSRRQPVQPLFPMDENGEEIESPTWLADPAANVQQTVEQQELSRNIYQILDKLPPVHRSILTLIDLYELDYTEAAEALRVPLGTVKSRLARARLQMKKMLRESMDYERALPDTKVGIVV